MLLKSRQNFKKVFAVGTHFQIKLRLGACHLQFKNIFQNRFGIHFTDELTTHVLLFQFFFFQTSKSVNLKY